MVEPRRRSRSVYAPALLIFLGIACDDTQPLDRLAVKGVFEPDTLDFGEVTVGTSSSLDVMLKNIGTLPYTIRSIEKPTGFELGGDAKVDLVGLTLAVGEAALLKAQFLAVEEGEKSGEIVVHAEETKIILKVHGIAVVRRAPAGAEPSFLTSARWRSAATLPRRSSSTTATRRARSTRSR
jgi:hypothetical protein